MAKRQVVEALQRASRDLEQAMSDLEQVKALDPRLVSLTAHALA